jgi:hypothetical protein
MTDITEIRRAGFEAWANTVGLSVTRASQGMMFANGRRVPAGGYVLFESVTAWMAYNAALGSVVVDLPKPYQNHLDGDVFDADDVIAAIHAAGIKTK